LRISRTFGDAPSEKRREEKRREEKRREELRLRLRRTRRDKARRRRRREELRERCALSLARRRRRREELRFSSPSAMSSSPSFTEGEEEASISAQRFGAREPLCKLPKVVFAPLTRGKRGEKQPTKFI